MLPDPEYIVSKSLDIVVGRAILHFQKQGTVASRSNAHCQVAKWSSSDDHLPPITAIGRSVKQTVS